MLLWVDNNEEKKHIDTHIDTRNNEIELLYSILSEKFNINSRQKVEELIDLYQSYIEKRSLKEKKRNRIIVAFFSACASVLALSFENMETIGINFNNWIFWTFTGILFVATASIAIYIIFPSGNLKNKYELMIRDLREMILLKY